MTKTRGGKDTPHHLSSSAADAGAVEKGKGKNKGKSPGKDKGKNEGSKEAKGREKRKIRGQYALTT